jgi:hypothetical protein
MSAEDPQLQRTWDKRAQRRDKRDFRRLRKQFQLSFSSSGRCLTYRRLQRNSVESFKITLYSP